MHIHWKDCGAATSAVEIARMSIKTGDANLALGSSMDTTPEPRLEPPPPPPDETPEAKPERDLKTYLVGPTHSNPVVHGWSMDTILHNHLPENVAKATDKPFSTVVAVILTRDRPQDRPTGADAISDVLVELKLAKKDEFVVIPPMPHVGDPASNLNPHTNLIICSNSDLCNSIENDVNKAVVHTRPKDSPDGFTFYLMPLIPQTSWLVHDPEVMRMVQQNHERIPDVTDIPTAIRAILHWAEVKACRVFIPARPGRDGQQQNGIRLYMPPPSFDDEAIKAWKNYLSSSTFSFTVDCHGRASPFRPFKRNGHTLGIACPECLGLDHYRDDCPITSSPGFKAVHMNEAELASASVGTNLASLQTGDDDGFQVVQNRNNRFHPMRGMRGSRSCSILAKYPGYNQGTGLQNVWIQPLLASGTPAWVVNRAMGLTQRLGIAFGGIFRGPYGDVWSSRIVSVGINIIAPTLSAPRLSVDTRLVREHPGRRLPPARWLLPTCHIPPHLSHPAPPVTSHISSSHSFHQLLPLCLPWPSLAVLRAGLVGSVLWGWAPTGF
ncbi:hypothetical protein C8F01DRAFT_1143697 [Mycena amicta]|nr:hypothetical protein C8F01DRAFT_1143697 [Mycena amicta]